MSRWKMCQEKQQQNRKSLKQNVATKKTGFLLKSGYVKHQKLKTA